MSDKLERVNYWVIVNILKEFDSKYKQTWLGDNIGTNHLLNWRYSIEIVVIEEEYPTDDDTLVVA